jgi:hypothetical protein
VGVKRGATWDGSLGVSIVSSDTSWESGRSDCLWPRIFKEPSSIEDAFEVGPWLGLTNDVNPWELCRTD